MAGNFLRGAFIEYVDTGLIPAPNVIIFQFNPEQLTHTWQPASTQYDGNVLAVSGYAGESFQFDLKMDANDMLADGSPVAQALATASGIYTRIAALEMLLQPTSSMSTNPLLQTAAAAASSVGAGPQKGTQVPSGQLPTVLFVWGPGRILPIKVTSLTFTETIYDSVLLNPIHAEASIGIQVLTPTEIQFLTGPLATVAQMSYSYANSLRQALAVANLANSAESAVGMLPF